MRRQATNKLATLCFGALLIAGPIAVTAQTVENRDYGGEMMDWGIAPQSAIRQGAYHAPTPTSIPGGRVIYTRGLEQALNEQPKPVLVNVLSGGSVRGVAGSTWLSGGGAGNSFDDPTQERLAQRLAALTGGNKAATIVFYCQGSQCWLSYNATLRALKLGYANATWYRGGIEAWRAAGLALTTINRDEW
jgi:PQQ-dependent catabolism-associated CXXCW motif protein